jgi:probable O-glycosylation ligase (exosortase A-associated)
LSALIGLCLAYFPPLVFFGALGALVGGVAIFLQPFVGVLLYAALFILRPGEAYPILGALHLERVIGMLTLSGIFLGMLRRKGSIALDISPQSKWLWLFTGSIILSIPFSYWIGHSVDTFIDMLKIVAFYIMVVYLVNSRRRLKIFVWTYLALVGYLGISSLLGYYSGDALFAQGIDRAVGATSAGGGANELGTTLASILPLFLLLVLAETAFWGRALAAAGGAVSLWAMVLTGSRASLLGCLSGLVYLWWRSKNRLLSGVVGLAIVATGFMMMPDQYKSRYSTMTKSELDGSSKGRIAAWMTGMNMVIDRPLFGVGAGCFGTARAMGYSPGSRKNWLESHSIYIQVVTELGLIGTIAFFGLIYNFLKLNRRTAKLVSRLGRNWKWESAILTALFAGFIVLVMSGFFGHSLYRRTWYVFAAVGLAIYRIYRAEREKESSVVS